MSKAVSLEEQQMLCRDVSLNELFRQCRLFLVETIHLEEENRVKVGWP